MARTSRTLLEAMSGTDLNHFGHSQALLERARQSVAGGVNSNVRLWERPHPLFFESGEGPFLTDVDGNRIIDYVLGQGPMLLGHRPPPVVEAVEQQLRRGILYGAQQELEVEVAEAICEIVPSAELVRFNMTGTEAVQAALRLARAATGRSKVVKFEGHYHGWADSVLYNVSAVGDQDPRTRRVKPVPESAGMPQNGSGDLFVLPWNDSEVVEQLLADSAEEIAALIMEPIMANSGVIGPAPGYLERVREACSRHGVVLIFDEVITGFRVDLAGAQGLFGVTPDLSVFGKALASGLPIGCVAGRAEFFEGVIDGRITHAGTFNASPLVMAASRATLRLLEEEAHTVYGSIRERGHRLMNELGELLRSHRLPVVIQGFPAVFSLLFDSLDRNQSHRDVIQADFGALKHFLACAIEHGVRFAGRGNWFLSTTHDDDVVDETLERTEKAILAFIERK